VNESNGRPADGAARAAGTGNEPREPGGLREADLAADPLEQFARWLADATGTGMLEPLAMAVATATGSGEPTARMVLLRGFDQRGFVFYTNYDSDKGRALDANPRAALVFYWDALGRQVRVEGSVERVSRDESEAYFRSRPIGSRLAAWASDQSTVVAGGRDELEERYASVEARFATGDVPLPPFWGGYRVVPERIEFWHSRENRLHDRLRYRRDGTGWVVERLAP
jgi:pyridoxamine 5'-phosphate oxidase